MAPNRSASTLEERAVAEEAYSGDTVAEHESIGDDTVAGAEELLGAIATLRRAALKHAAKPVELTALSGAQQELVRLVRRRPGVSVAEAAAALRLAPNTVSTLVRALTDKKMVTRYVDPADRRVARLDLDPGVRRTVHAWRDRRAEAVAAASLRLTAEDRAGLDAAARVLSRLAEELEAT